MHNLTRTMLLTIASQPLLAVAAESPIGTGSVDAMAFVKMLLGLLFTLGIIFVLAWLSRKSKLINNISPSYQIKTLATQSLSHREKLCLVEVGGKQILLGLAPGQISKVHVFDEPIEQIEPDELPTVTTAFASQFKKALGMHNQPTEQKD